jgi:hypothetical protein
MAVGYGSSLQQPLAASRILVGRRHYWLNETMPSLETSKAPLYWRGAKSFSQNDVEMSYSRHLDNYSDKPDLVHLHHWSSP